MEPNAPLAYAPGTELHWPIMSTLGGHGDRLEINIYIYIYMDHYYYNPEVFVNQLNQFSLWNNFLYPFSKEGFDLSIYSPYYSITKATKYNYSIKCEYHKVQLVFKQLWTMSGNN